MKYEKESMKDFRLSRQALKSNREELLAAIRASDVSFLADFHTLFQNQKTALEIIREAFQKETEPHWLIGLEFVPSQFQCHLDQYQTGAIDTEEFHQRISYSKEWGFPWENYEPIFSWAMENQVPMVALNRPKQLYLSDEADDLHARDEWAAGIITDRFVYHLKKGTRPKIAVLYGELHVATSHLPHQLDRVSKAYLNRPLSWVTVHQNPEPLYWKLSEKHPHLWSEVVRLRNSVYCVFSSTPIEKLQSFITWAEDDPEE